MNIKDNSYLVSSDVGYYSLQDIKPIIRLVDGLDEPYEVKDAIMRRLCLMCECKLYGIDKIILDLYTSIRYTEAEYLLLRFGNTACTYPEVLVKEKQYRAAYHTIKASRDSYISIINTLHQYVLGNPNSTLKVLAVTNELEAGVNYFYCCSKLLDWYSLDGKTYNSFVAIKRRSSSDREYFFCHTLHLKCVSVEGNRVDFIDVKTGDEYLYSTCCRPAFDYKEQFIPLSTEMQLILDSVIQYQKKCGRLMPFNPDKGDSMLVNVSERKRQEFYATERRIRDDINIASRRAWDNGGKQEYERMFSRDQSECGYYRGGNESFVGVRP